MKLELKANTHLMNSQEIHNDKKRKNIYVRKGENQAQQLFLPTQRIEI